MARIHPNKEELITKNNETIETARLAQSLFLQKGWQIVEDFIAKRKTDVENELFVKGEIDFKKASKVAGMIELKNYLEGIAMAGVSATEDNNKLSQTSQETAT
jgi:hypothetical protein